MPPASSSVLPFSRTVIVMTTSCVSKPLIVLVAPVFLTSKSISTCFSFFSAGFAFSSFAAVFCSCSSAFLRASSIFCRSSAKVVTL